MAGSLNPVPNDLNQPSRKSIKVTGLKPSQTYSIEKGTPALADEYITSGYADYMEIIPLAENLVTSP